MKWYKNWHNFPAVFLSTQHEELEIVQKFNIIAQISK